MRKIIHCDCDCFYAAVEMRDNPALTDIPIAIGGSVEQRGVVAADFNADGQPDLAVSQRGVATWLFLSRKIN